MAVEGRDARVDRHLPVAPRTAGDPGRYLHFLPAGRFLGSVGGRLGLHFSELRDRGGARCALRLFRRSQAGDRDLLRREPGGDRVDPALLLPARGAPQGRMGGNGGFGGVVFWVLFLFGGRGAFFFPRPPPPPPLFLAAVSPPPP